MVVFWKELSARGDSLDEPNSEGRLHLPRTTIKRLAEQPPVTTDTALRLAKYFRTTPDFWLNLQSAA